MVMTKTTATSLIVIGIIELVLGAIAIICGIVSMIKLTSPAATTIGIWAVYVFQLLSFVYFLRTLEQPRRYVFPAEKSSPVNYGSIIVRIHTDSKMVMTKTIGIWAVYFAIPGILCIVAGISLSTGMLGVCLGMNIVGIVFAGISMCLGGAFWAILNRTCIGALNVCACGNGDYDVQVYPASCSDLIVVRNATAAATFVYILLMLTTFVASIFGCIGTCCVPRDPQLIVASVQPQAGTIVVNSNQQTVAMPSHPYPAVAHPSYAQMQPPPYDGQINLEFAGESQKNF